MFDKRLPARIVGLWLLSTAAAAMAGTELSFWHSYTHQSSGVVHFSFHIASYKRGFFFGSCGLATRSLQWEYDVDLAGSGPRYTSQEITLSKEGKPIPVASGTIRIDPRQQHATIELRTTQPGLQGTNDFIGNGTHRIQKLK